MIISVVKDQKLEILYLNSVDSTHKYLKQYINDNGYIEPIAVFTSYQTDGIGSRDNFWQGKKENFYLSFVLSKDCLPCDIPLQSLSIYFTYLLKNILKNNNSKVWLKWPNDFYIGSKKIGGTITNVSNKLVYCGIGINLIPINKDFGYLDIDIDIEEILKEYFSTLEEFPSWKQIFSKYLLEFNHSKNFFTTIENEKVSLSKSFLNDDGSLTIDNKKVFSLR